MCGPVGSSHVRQPTPTQSVAGIQDKPFKAQAITGLQLTNPVLTFIAAASKSFSTMWKALS